MTEKQRLYIDNTNYYLLEKLNHPRVFIYERDESKQAKLVKWKCIKRFNKFPENLESDSGFLRVLSPGFQRYVNISGKLN